MAPDLDPKLPFVGQPLDQSRPETKIRIQGKTPSVRVDFGREVEPSGFSAK